MKISYYKINRHTVTVHDNRNLYHIKRLAIFLMHYKKLSIFNFPKPVLISKTIQIHTPHVTYTKELEAPVLVILN